MIYKQRVLKILAEAKPSESAPLLIKRIADIQTEMFGNSVDYAEIKYHYNEYVMKSLPLVEERIARAEDSLYRAIQYSLIGNYIDFGAMKTIDQKQFEEMIDGAEDLLLEESEYRNLRGDILQAERLVYLTDNCGEIALDKALILEIKRVNPKLDVTAVVRGEPILNDATYEDAKQVELTNEVRVVGNGNNVAGTCIELLSVEARTAVEGADVLIAKGQGNFETLQGCGLNVYYLFMCKCDLFAKKFQVRKYEGLLLNDRHIGGRLKEREKNGN